MVAWTPSSLNALEDTPLTLALVETAINAGVSIFPCGVVRTPARACEPAAFTISNETGRMHRQPNKKRSKSQLLSYVYHLNLENKCCVWRYGAVTLRAVGKLRRDNEQALATLAHSLDTLVPTWYHLASTQHKSVRLPANRCVKHRTVIKCAGVVHGYNAANDSFLAGTNKFVLHHKLAGCTPNRVSTKPLLNYGKRISKYKKHHNDADPRNDGNASGKQ